MQFEGAVIPTASLAGFAIGKRTGSNLCSLPPGSRRLRSQSHTPIERPTMGFLDKFKKKAGDLADDHGDKATDAIDKGADFVDDKTGGKHTDKIESGAEKAKDLVEGLGDDDK
jgi:hypothetical protein